MKRILSFLLAVLLLLCGCGTEIDKQLVTQPVIIDAPPVQEPYPISFDNEVFDAAPKTVASLSPALTEILWDYCPEKIVGVSEYCDYPAMAAEKPSIGSPAEPDIEAILELKPELLMISSPLAAADILKIKQGGTRVLKLDVPTNFSQLCEIYIKIAMIFDGAVDFQNSAKENLSKLEDSVHAASNAPKASFVIVEGKAADGGLLLSHGQTLAADMLSLYGDNLWAESERFIATKEELFELAPEVVFFAEGLDKKVIEKNFPHSKLIGIDFERFERPTRRIAEVLDYCTGKLS